MAVGRRHGLFEMVGGCWLATVQFRVPMSFRVEELRAEVKTQSNWKPRLKWVQLSMK
jgi:hypothetical protein